MIKINQNITKNPDRRNAQNEKKCNSTSTKSNTRLAMVATTIPAAVLLLFSLLHGLFLSSFVSLLLDNLLRW